jgi:hypothetical protein
VWPSIEVPTQPFDKHRDLIIAQQNVTVDFKKIKGFPVDAEEFLALSKTTVRQNPKHSCILMMVDAKVEALVLVIGSRIPNEHMPQPPIR